MSDPLHLFLMTNTLETGGSERQFVGSAKAISHEHFKIHLGCLLRYGPLLNQVGDITEFPLGGSFFTWQAWRSRFNLIRYLRTKQIDVAHSFDFYTNLMLLPLARLARVPVIVGSHRQIPRILVDPLQCLPLGVERNDARTPHRGAVRWVRQRIGGEGTGDGRHDNPGSRLVHLCTLIGSAMVWVATHLPGGIVGSCGHSLIRSRSLLAGQSSERVDRLR